MTNKEKEIIKKDLSCQFDLMSFENHILDYIYWNDERQRLFHKMSVQDSLNNNTGLTKNLMIEKLKKYEAINDFNI